MNVCGNEGWFIAYAWIYEAKELRIKFMRRFYNNEKFRLFWVLTKIAEICCESEFKNKRDFPASFQCLSRERMIFFNIYTISSTLKRTKEKSFHAASIFHTTSLSHTLRFSRIFSYRERRCERFRRGSKKFTLLKKISFFTKNIKEKPDEKLKFSSRLIVALHFKCYNREIINCANWKFLWEEKVQTKME